jgi:hypothetical protein
MHEKLPSVYAFKSQIDAWSANRRLRPDPEEESPQPSPAVSGARLGFDRSLRKPNGGPVFDGSLEYALERELSNSRFVNVVPRERINDTLHLMKRPLDTPLDRAVSREICLRDEREILFRPPLLLPGAR